MEEALDPNLLYTRTQSNSMFSKEKQNNVGGELGGGGGGGEIALLKTEMKNMLEYHSSKLQKLENLLKDYRSHDSAFGRGAVSRLQALNNEVKLQLTKCSKLFSNFLSSTECDWNCDNHDYSDGSSSDEDNDKTDEDDDDN